MPVDFTFPEDQTSNGINTVTHRGSCCSQGVLWGKSRGLEVIKARISREDSSGILSDESESLLCFLTEVHANQVEWICLESGL